MSNREVNEGEGLENDLFKMVASLGGKALVLINVVTLCWAQLVLGWVTVCGRVNHLGM